jgi:hypothetical protein
MDKSPDINASEGDLDQIIGEILKKYFMVVQPPNTTWQHIRYLLESFIGDCNASEHRVQ